MLGGCWPPKFILYCDWYWGCGAPPPGPAPGRWSRSRNLGNVGISLGSQGSGPSLKYEDCRHSSAVALFVGSYLQITDEKGQGSWWMVDHTNTHMNRKLRSRSPAADSQGNLCLRLL